MVAALSRAAHDLQACCTGQEPQFYRDEAGIRYLKTKKGNPVAVTADGRGNVMMVDPAGNLYYDGGSPQLGIYMVPSHGATAVSASTALILHIECAFALHMFWQLSIVGLSIMLASSLCILLLAAPLHASWLGSTMTAPQCRYTLAVLHAFLLVLQPTTVKRMHL